jgi:type II secretory pathway component GspD/PulD (secretin)
MPENPPHPERKRRRLLQLRLSTLLLVMAMFALAAGWWADRLRLEKKIRMLTNETVVFHLKYVQSDDAVRILSQMYPGETKLAFGSDSRSNSIVVSGPVEAIASIEASINRLDQ